MSKLYIIPTPIGNLEDITLRAIKILKEVHFIIAEDTRKTGKLIKHLKLEKKKMIAHHQFNEHQNFKHIAEIIESGQSAALVSNAGTPVISDPGFLLVRECISRGIEIESLPGPTSIIPALINSGLPADRFFFEGFLPHKKGRLKRLKELSELQHTIILLESPNRIGKCFQQIAEIMGPERKTAVSREISKIYEETIRGTAEELAAHFDSNSPKGECIIIVEGKKAK